METARIKRFALVQALLLAATLLFVGCVPDEADFKADHPAPGGTADPSGANLTCPSSLTGDGSISNPGALGTAPVCFQPAAKTTDIYYSVTVPNTGVWFFQIVNLTADFDIVVYSGTSFADNRILCFSDNEGTTDDVCEINIDPAGLGGILVENFTGSSTALYRLEVVQ